MRKVRSKVRTPYLSFKYIAVLICESPIWIFAPLWRHSDVFNGPSHSQFSSAWSQWDKSRVYNTMAVWRENSNWRFTNKYCYVFETKIGCPDFIHKKLTSANQQRLLNKSCHISFSDEKMRSGYSRLPNRRTPQSKGAFKNHVDKMRWVGG